MKINMKYYWECSDALDALLEKEYEYCPQEQRQNGFWILVQAKQKETSEFSRCFHRLYDDEKIVFWALYKVHHRKHFMMEALDEEIQYFHQECPKNGKNLMVVYNPEYMSEPCCPLQICEIIITWNVEKFPWNYFIRIPSRYHVSRKPFPLATQAPIALPPSHYQYPFSHQNVFIPHQEDPQREQRTLRISSHKYGSVETFCSPQQQFYHQHQYHPQQYPYPQQYPPQYPQQYPQQHPQQHLQYTRQHLQQHLHYPHEQQHFYNSGHSYSRNHFHDQKRNHFHPYGKEDRKNESRKSKVRNSRNSSRNNKNVSKETLKQENTDQVNNEIKVHDDLNEEKKDNEDQEDQDEDDLEKRVQENESYHM